MRNYSILGHSQTGVCNTNVGIEHAEMALLLLAVGAHALAVPPAISGNITFHPPVSLGPTKWGVTMFAAFNYSTHVVQVRKALLFICCCQSSFI